MKKNGKVNLEMDEVTFSMLLTDIERFAKCLSEHANTLEDGSLARGIMVRTRFLRKHIVK